METPFVDLHAATWDERSLYSLAPDARRFENWERNAFSLLAWEPQLTMQHRLASAGPA
ncbi:hypothetical protein BH23CHL5_BH23CHL5_20690 [soil metagenome]